MKTLMRIVLFLLMWYALLLLGGGGVGPIELVVSFLFVLATFLCVGRLIERGQQRKA